MKMKNICNLKCSVATLIIGAILVVGVFVIAFVVVPLVIENIIIGEVALINDTIQMERFETVPFPMAFSVTVLEITNPEQVLQGEVPEMTEVGPYVYKLYQTRDITSVEGDLIRYLRTEHFEFDTEASYPHTEDDLVTIVNVPYHMGHWPTLFRPVPSYSCGNIRGSNGRVGTSSSTYCGHRKDKSRKLG